MGENIIVTLENHIDHRADYLRYFSEFIAHCESQCYAVLYFISEFRYDTG